MLSWQHVDIDPINRFFGTHLKPGDFDTIQVPRSWRMLADHLPTPSTLIKLSLLMRYTRVVSAGYDVLFGVYNETDYGRRGIQYIHYPTYLRPRPMVDLRWYHPPQASLNLYYELADRIAGKASAKPIDPDWLTLQIAEALPRDAVLVNEGLTSARHITDLVPYRDRYSYHALASGGIGWGLPAAIGVAMANAILLVTFAEGRRRGGEPAAQAAVTGAASRLRAILMTSCAMIAGMLPMALGLGEAGQQNAPLGRAVIGGLAAATFATLFVLPSVFAWIQAGASTQSASLDPGDASATATAHT